MFYLAINSMMNTYNTFDVIEDVEKIRKKIKAFQIEQEIALSKIGALPRDRNSHVKITLAANSLINKNKSRNEKTVEKFLDIDCIIVPDTSNRRFNPSKSWPCSLIALYSEKFADLGNIESYGSLWRIKKFENHSKISHAVVLQASEIGEVPMFLSNTLDLVDSIESAAKWIIRLVTPEERNVSQSASEAAMFTEFSLSAINAGLFVSFQLIDLDAEGEEDAASGSGSYLVGAVSDDGDLQGIAVLSAAHLTASREGPECVDWLACWEVVAEESCSAIGALGGAEFLEEEDEEEE